ATFSLANGNSVQMSDDPNAAEGYGPPYISDRLITGRIDPQENLVATTDYLGRWRAGNKDPLVAALGSTAGNRIGIIVPEAKRANVPTVGARNGEAIRNIEIEATTPDGGAIFVFH